MGLVENAAKDTAGLVEAGVGKVLDKDEMVERGEQKRAEALVAQEDLEADKEANNVDEGESKSQDEDKRQEAEEDAGQV